MGPRRRHVPGAGDLGHGGVGPQPRPLPRRVAGAVRAVAHADADIKGQAHDASYTLERLVLTVAGLRESR